jgi:hypothetical protein
MGRIGSMTSELAGNIKAAAQGAQIVFLLDIATGHSFPDRLRQLVAEDADQDFEQRLSLPRQVGYRSEVDLQIERHGQHVDQTFTDRSILIIDALARRDVDFWQDFQTAAFRGQNPNDPPRS